MPNWRGSTKGKGSMFETTKVFEDPVVPIKAWKLYTLGGSNHTVWLSSNHLSGVYFTPKDLRKEQVARCRAYSFSVLHAEPAPHVLAPHVSCNCGFHAVKEISELDNTKGVITEVNLFGKVILHEKGYRAEKQQIMGIYIRRTICCGSFLCEEQPERLSFPITEKKSKIRTAKPVCGQHGKIGYTVSLAQVANRLGIEVSWADNLDQNRS